MRAAPHSRQDGLREVDVEHTFMTARSTKEGTKGRLSLMFDGRLRVLRSARQPSCGDKKPHEKAERMSGSMGLSESRELCFLVNIHTLWLLKV